MYQSVSFLGDYRTLCPVGELTIFPLLRTIGPTSTPAQTADIDGQTQTTP
jgi:hypothetical protein